ncbi:hypothetical protein OV079_02535 [Nannocystis pusilla]|uniref:Uncharacterized protein n=1 Tax=Nannocystis pusilla TaxID=889268 RepID=A0A9X3EI15_9BACT|nr:hypothetical protein [Nannocystis pusilla]MCY1004463.1 hypothetical protein [Nannocystis pusilla]
MKLELFTDRRAVERGAVVALIEELEVAGRLGDVGHVRLAVADLGDEPLQVLDVLQSRRSAGELQIGGGLAVDVAQGGREHAGVEAQKLLVEQVGREAEWTHGRREREDLHEQLRVADQFRLPPRDIQLRVAPQAHLELCGRELRGPGVEQRELS